jgi:zinc-ribbon domain
MFCSTCGSQIPDTSRFCAVCGATVDPSLTAAGGAGAPAQPAPQYVPPRQASSQPPVKPDRTAMWIAIGAAAVILIVAAIALPLLLIDRNEDDTAGSTTGSVTTTVTTEVVATTVPETTATTAAPPTTSPPTTVAPTTTTLGVPGDSAGNWTEIVVPGGPWEANGVAVSEDALLLQTSSAGGFKLSAVMFGSGDVIEISEADALWSFDIDGSVAVWWEGNAWDDAAQRYADQHIYTMHLPDGPTTEIVGGPPLGGAQIALPWVTWVEGEPWVDNPAEYQAFRIIAQRVDDNGVKVGTPREYVSLALAFMLGDSGWQYSVSNLYLTWEHALAAGGYEAGTHVLELETEDHGLISATAWRPSLWQDILAYSDSGLKYTRLSAGGTHDLDPAGEYPTAGPTFVAYYRLAGAGSEIVAKGYNGNHEQVLGTNPDPPWWCPAIAVSERHIAFTIGTEVHLFEWGG